MSTPLTRAAKRLTRWLWLLAVLFVLMAVPYLVAPFVPIAPWPFALAGAALLVLAVQLGLAARAAARPDPTLLLRRLRHFAVTLALLLVLSLLVLTAALLLATLPTGLGQTLETWGL